MYSHTHKYTEMRNTHIKIAYTLLRVRLTHKLRDRALPGRPQHAHIFTGSQPYLAGQALALLSHPQAAQPSLSHLPTPIREGAGPAALLSVIPVAGGILLTLPGPFD